jgi:hypothetical protein
MPDAEATARITTLTRRSAGYLPHPAAVGYH